MFPKYFEEIDGIATGAFYNKTRIIIMSLDDELSYFAPNSSNIDSPNNDTIYKFPQSCSDYMVVNDNEAYLAHNEDNIPETINITYIVNANILDNEPFTSYGYAGELLTQAVGWNRHILFTGNYVCPSNPVVGGLGRNFVARGLLELNNLNDALRHSSQNGQCGGHNYQIIQWKNIKNVSGSEIAYDGLHAFTFVNLANSDSTLYMQGNWTFHANRYIHLNISQCYDSDFVSSEYREQRALQLGRPQNLNDMLNNLGDNENLQWPIYKTGPSDYTLHTFGVDISNCNVRVYANNPKLRNEIFEFNVNCAQ